MKIFNQPFLLKIINFSSFIWAISCWFFFLIIFYSTKLFTYDPNFSGGKETYLLLPMLFSVFVGFVSFLIFLIFSLIYLVKKNKNLEKIEYRPILGISTKINLFSGLFSFIIFFVFLLGVRSGNIGYKKHSFNGQQLFEAINEYRVKRGKKPVLLELYICDNLVERYLKIKSGDVGHEGFEDWAKKEGINKNYIPRAELYVKDTYTIEDAIKFWDGSPGHRLALLEDYDVGCSYANEGIGVVVFGNYYQK
jgi:uncharacterized membrane protein (DUF485 family)